MSPKWGRPVIASRKNCYVVLKRNLKIAEKVLIMLLVCWRFCGTTVFHHQHDIMYCSWSRRWEFCLSVLLIYLHRWAIEFLHKVCSTSINITGCKYLSNACVCARKIYYIRMPFSLLKYKYTFLLATIYLISLNSSKVSFMITCICNAMFTFFSNLKPTLNC